MDEDAPARIRGLARQAAPLTRLLPLAVLAAVATVIVAASPGGLFGLTLAVVPFIAAVLHGAQSTALMGGLSVGAYASLQHWMGNDDSTGLRLTKLGFVAVAATAAVLISQARARERELTRSRDTALTLQRGLLPHDFPRTSAADVCHRYVPADTAAGVGGDWFDVIALPGSRVALVMGDVVGHGLHAAATMGRLRTAVHTLADLDLAPEELMARMDDLVRRMGNTDGGHEPSASCLYMVYDPITRRCTTANAGQTPPAVAFPGEGVRFHRDAENPPLGFGAAPFATTTAVLPEGTVIALYTDGLLDLRRQEPDAAAAALAGALLPADRPLDTICDGVHGVHGVHGVRGDPGAHGFRGRPPAEHDDDMALLLARTRALPADRVADRAFSTGAEDAATARSLVAEQLDVWGLEEHTFPMELVASELVTNAVRHAQPPVSLRLIHDHSLICEVTDSSSTAPHLRTAQPMDEGGRGLYLVGELTDRWGVRYTEGGKTIWAEKNL